MFSLLKKTVIAVAVAITVAVAASPVDYLSAESDVYAYVNTSSLMEVKTLQQFIPLIEKELQEDGLKINDFEGELALGMNISAENKKVMYNIDIVYAFKNAVAKKLFDSIKKGDAEMTATTVSGKPALKDENGRIILQSPKLLIAQIHAEGTKPFSTLTNKGNNPLKQIKSQMQKFDVFMFANVENLLNKFQSFIPAADKDTMDIPVKAKVAYLFVKFLPNDKLYLNLSIECKSADDAESFAAFVKVFIDRMSKDQNLKPLLGKIQSKAIGTRVTISVTLDNNEFVKIQQLAK